MNQVKNMMLVTVWVFIGIEGAAVYSQRAKKRKDVGRPPCWASSPYWPCCSR